MSAMDLLYCKRCATLRKAYRSMLAPERASTLVGLDERGRVAKDEVFDEIT